MPITAVLRDRLALATCLERVRTDPADIWVYGYDNSRKHAPPDAVVFATSHREVQDVVRACFEAGVPIVARGRGTATTGAAIPVRGGVVLALERMNRILKVDPANRVLVVEPGVTNQAVQDAAREHGFFWPPDPTWTCARCAATWTRGCASWPTATTTRWCWPPPGWRAWSATRAPR